MLSPDKPIVVGNRELWLSAGMQQITLAIVAENDACQT